MKIAFIIGTRPELIKVAPIILEAMKSNITCDVVNTAQHKDLLDPYWSSFGLKPTHILDVMVPGQNLTSLTSRALNQIQKYIDDSPIKPEIILAQGDTTTVLSASIVSFYNRIKFAHVEAGLRSHDLYSPFPEELNRKIASIIADYHFCPTTISKQNLINEGVPTDRIYIVGNTVVDSLAWFRSKVDFDKLDYRNDKLNEVNKFEKCVLITCHRRENQGKNLLSIIDTIYSLALESPNIMFIWTMHPNPQIKSIILESSLNRVNNVLLVDPLEYIDLLNIMAKSICIISDSGGIQEEAPSFNKPVIVLRDTTERPEGINQGLAFLAGSDKGKIFDYFKFISNNTIEFKSNPYGDGKSSERILQILKEG